MEDKYEIKIDEYGKYYHKNGNFHRDDGPAKEYIDGDKEWFIEGKRHRLDGPAVENSNGDKNGGMKVKE